jgi:hypothetical protein
MFELWLQRRGLTPTAGDENDEDSSALPPTETCFTGLDTLPSLGIVLLSLGVLLEDIVVVVVGLIVGVAGVVLEVVLGSAAINALGKLV